MMYVIPLYECMVFESSTQPQCTLGQAGTCDLLFCSLKVYAGEWVVTAGRSRQLRFGRNL